MQLNNIRSPSAILKMIEIMLLIIIMACFFSQFYGWGPFVSSVFVGCFLQAIVFLANLLMGYDQIQKTPLELMLYTYYWMAIFISAILLFTTGHPPWIVAGVFCIILAIVYGLELYVAYKNLTGNNTAAPPGPQIPQYPFPPPMPQQQQQQHQQHQQHQQQQPPAFPTERYPPPPTYPNNPPMQSVDLGSGNGNPFDESRLQQL